MRDLLRTAQTGNSADKRRHRPDGKRCMVWTYRHYRVRWDSPVAVGSGRYPLVMATRERVNVDLDAEVAAILRKHAAEAHVSEGEIVDRAVRAYDLRALLSRLQANSDLDDDQAMALARQELKAARTARHAAG